MSNMSSHKVRMFLIIFILSTFSNAACIYAENDNKPVQKINRAEIEHDIRYFFDKFKQVHPNPYYILNSSSLDSLKENLIHNLPDIMNAYELWKLLNTKLNPILDAHTRFNYLPVGNFDAEKDLLFPNNIRVDAYNNVFMDNNKKVLAINNVDIELIVKDFLYVFSMENHLTSLMFFQNLFPIILRSYFGEQKRFVVTYYKDNDQYIDTLNAISYQDYLKIAETYYDEYRIIEHESERIMYVRYMSFENVDATKELTEKMFSIIKNEGIKSLVIDLRSNGGGDSQCIDFIEEYIYNSRYKTESSIIRNSKDYRSIFKIHNVLDCFKSRVCFETFIIKKSKVAIEGERKVGNNNGNKCLGDVFVLVSPMTHSCAADLAYRIKLNNRGVIIGSGIGQPIHSFTNIRKFELNESKLMFSLPTTECIFENIPSEKNFLKMDYNIEFQSPVNFNNDSVWLNYIFN